jgi:hypothetical protein
LFFKKGILFYFLVFNPRVRARPQAHKKAIILGHLCQAKSA